MLTPHALFLYLPVSPGGVIPARVCPVSGNGWQVIPLTNATVTLEGVDGFDVSTSRKAYNFRVGSSAEAGEWVRTLKSVVETAMESSLMEAANNMGQDWAESSMQTPLLAAITALGTAAASSVGSFSTQTSPPAALLSLLRGKRVDMRCVVLPSGDEVLGALGLPVPERGDGAMGGRSGILKGMGRAGAGQGSSPVFSRSPGSGVYLRRGAISSSAPSTPARYLPPALLELEGRAAEERKREGHGMGLPPSPHALAAAVTPPLALLEATVISGAPAPYLARGAILCAARDRRKFGENHFFGRFFTIERSARFALERQQQQLQEGLKSPPFLPSSLDASTYPTLVDAAAAALSSLSSRPNSDTAGSFVGSLEPIRTQTLESFMGGNQMAPPTSTVPEPSHEYEPSEESGVSSSSRDSKTVGGSAHGSKTGQLQSPMAVNTSNSPAVEKERRAFANSSSRSSASLRYGGGRGNTGTTK